MEKWEIRPMPDGDDPRRHILLMRGGPADVAALLKKFGALFGRPTPYRGEGYNLSLVLRRLKPDAHERLEAWLQKFVPTTASEVTAEVAPEAEPTSAPEAAPEPVPQEAVESLPEAAAEPVWEAQPEAAAETVEPVAEGAYEAAPEASESVPEAAPEFAPQEAVEPRSEIVLDPQPGVPPDQPPQEAVEPTPEPAPEPVAEAVVEPTAEPAVEAATESVPSDSAPLSLSPAPEMPLALPLREDWTFESLLVGAYNRFAHAAAMSAVSSPGTMYNPLFLYGVPGTGKSHLLHAIGAGLSKSLGAQSILHTSGARLSRVMNSAIAHKKTAPIDKRVAESKALLVDDIHLMAISDRNKDALSKFFKSFLDRKLQVVITSLYPPRTLGAIEEALKFSFSKGWSVDLKVPSPAAQKELIAAAADRSKIELDAPELALLHEKLSQWGYQELSLWFKRLGLFKGLRASAGLSASMQDILPILYDPLLVGGVEPPPAAFTSKFQPPLAADDAEPMAVIVPKGKEGLGPFAASRFYEVGSKNGFTQIYRHVLWKTYDADEPHGVPFLIGEMCYRARAARALIVGPLPDSPLGQRAAGFSHAVRRILESLGIESAWVPYGGLEIPAHYINAHLDLTPVTRPS